MEVVALITQWLVRDCSEVLNGLCAEANNEMVTEKEPLSVTNGRVPMKGST